MKLYEKFRLRWAGTIVGQATDLLPTRDLKRVIAIIFVQIFMGLLDLFGVVMLGALGALSVQGLESKSAGNRVSILLGLLNIRHSSLQTQVMVIGLTAAALLIGKTILSVILIRRIYYFLSRKAAQISAETMSRLLTLNLLGIQKRTSQQILFMVTTGVQNLMIGVLATSVQILSDLSLLGIMVVGLIFVDPVMAIGTMFLFSAIAYLLHRLLQVRSRELGMKSAGLAVKNNEKILEVLNSYRESVVRNRRGFYSREIGEMRFALANVNAEASFMPYISKYVIDSTTVLGTLLLGAYEFTTNNAVHALAVMAVFLAASSRIAPAALRVQQGLLVLKNSAGAAEETLELIHELKGAPLAKLESDTSFFDYSGFKPTVEIRDLTFRYPSSSSFALDGVNLTVHSGSSVAIVGPSGAGKTTLIDLILGVLEPDSGNILISNHSPSAASHKWSGAISYVPQNPAIINGSVRQNIGLGYPSQLSTDERVLSSLKLAHLLELVDKSGQGIEMQVGENGSKLSGGQRQRLSIARALFTNPRLLVLDEATSALDGQTEASITESIRELKGFVTVIIIAHRLSTVRDVDQVVYMNFGKVLATGTFDEVRSAIPEFDQQAKLMGL